MSATEVSVAVGATETLTATIDGVDDPTVWNLLGEPADFEVCDVAGIYPSDDHFDISVSGMAEGETTITFTADNDDQTATPATITVTVTPAGA